MRSTLVGVLLLVACVAIGVLGWALREPSKPDVVPLAAAPRPPSGPIAAPGAASEASAVAAPTRPLVEPARYGQLEQRSLHGPRGDFPFLERRYEPAYLLPVFDAPADRSRLTSPEAVLACLYSAMKKGDFDWAASLFDDESRVDLLADIEHRPAYLAAWKEQMEGYDFLLTRRVDFAGRPERPASAPNNTTWAVIYKQRNREEEQPSPHGFIKLPDGTWRLTNALVNHPVYAYDKGQADVVVQTH